jgi:hypothetical protein
MRCSLRSKPENGKPVGIPSKSKPDPHDLHLIMRGCPLVQARDVVKMDVIGPRDPVHFQQGCRITVKMVFRPSEFRIQNAPSSF